MVIVGIFYIDGVEKTTIMIIGDETNRRCIWVFFHLLVIVDGG